MTFLNLNLMRNPGNWIVVALMVAIAHQLIAILINAKNGATS